MPIEKVNNAAQLVPVSKDEIDSLSYSGVREETLKANPSLRTMFNKNRKTRRRILMVADGILGFDDGEFGLSELIHKALLPSALPWEELEIVTAHRSINDTTADIPGFRFDETPDAPYDRPFTKQFYDQVWLFGSCRVNSEDGIHDDSEREALLNFMNDGGGVFATGDHQDLGAGLCFEVPRVKHMRKWLFRNVPPELQAPGVSDETRIDTLREGFDRGFQFNDQSDRIPQTIYPRFRVKKTYKGPEPHELLSYRNSAITVLPDHMHEGECIVPTDLDKKFVEFDKGKYKDKYDEFPPLRRKEERLSPEVVAVATSAGGVITDLTNVGPSNPRCYNVIVAYEGDHVDMVKNGKRTGKPVGRIVVDSTFHHFINVNLNGTGSADPFKRGLYDSFGRPTRDYFTVLRYYRNIVTWLTPKDGRTNYSTNLLIGVRYLYPLIEEIQPIKHPTLRDKIEAGVLTRRAITERFSRAEATQCTLAAISLLPEDSKALLEQFINPWLPSELIEEELTLLFNAEAVSTFCLGHAMLKIASLLPETAEEASELLEEMESQGKQLGDLIAVDRDPALELLAKTIEESRKNFLEFSAILEDQR